MSASRRAAPRGAQPTYGAAQRRTTVTPCLGQGAGGGSCHDSIAGTRPGRLQGSHRRADRELLLELRALRPVRRGLPVLHRDRRPEIHADPQTGTAAPRLAAGIHAARPAGENGRPGQARHRRRADRMGNPGLRQLHRCADAARWSARSATTSPTWCARCAKACRPPATRPRVWSWPSRARWSRAARPASSGSRCRRRSSAWRSEFGLRDTGRIARTPTTWC